MAAGIAAFAVTTGAVACAADDDSEPPPREADASTDLASEATAADADDDASSSVDAGPCSDSGLCITPIPIDDTVGLTSVWGSSASDVWAVGSKGTVLHYDGSAWAKGATVALDGAAPYTLRSVWAGRRDDVWMVDGLNLWHGTGWAGSDATSWSLHTFAEYEPSPMTVRGHGDHAWLARRPILGSVGERLLKIDGWADTGPGPTEGIGPTLPFPEVILDVVMPTRADEAWAVGSQFVLDVSDPNAVTSLFITRVLHATKPMNDGGSSPAWELEEHDPRTTNQIFGMWGDESAVWLAGEHGTVRRAKRSAIATKAFEILRVPVLTDLHGVFGFGPDDVWFVGDASTVLHWDGTTFTKLATPFDAARSKPRLFAVWGSGPNDVWIAGDGTILHFQESSP
ncbi:MAG: Type fimbrial biosis protein PilY1 [Labilithrix sp.]|nr:Type fimbrial biosis protein PilY1 [Labilithrix sp.]